MSQVGVVTPWQINDYFDLPLPEYFALLSELGVKVIRARWMPGGRGDQVMSLCAQYGIKWLVSFIPESWGESGETRTIGRLQSALLARLTDMWAHPDAADVVIGVENVNEPNQGRSGAVIRADWPEMCAAFNQTMVSFRNMSGGQFVILSSAMHDLEDDRNNGGDWLKLAAAYNAVDTMPDVISVHSYNGDQPAGYKLAERLDRVNAAFPQHLPVWVTETGWYMLPAGGPPYTPPEQAAEYIRDLPARMLSDQVERVFYYELYGADRGLYWNGAWTPPGVALMDMYHA